MPNRIVIVGSGIAAISAIKVIREIDLESEIYLIGEEEAYPYNRIRLSKGIFELDVNKILLQKPAWYEENKVKIFTDTKVVNVDLDSQEVLLCNGSKVKYDKLLIATGACNSTPPINGVGKSGVYTLRNLKDALNIKKRLNECEEITVIGGGIQGLEMAWILHQHGKKVKVAELLPRLMPNQLDDKASQILKDTIETYKIQILTKTSVKEIIGDDKVEGILLDNGLALKCDMVIYSTGITPNKDFVENTKVKTGRGIIVNNKMETNIKNIYAAGDIAEYNNHVAGLWNIALAQGKVAGSNIIGNDTEYEYIAPVTTLNAFNISLFSMGCVDESTATKVIVNEQIDSNEYKKIFIKDNKIIGAIVIGDTRKSPILKSAIENETSLENIDLSHISIEELLDILIDLNKHRT